MAGLSKEQQALKERFTAELGYWSETWDDMLSLAPDFVAAYLEFAAIPFRHGTHLSPKDKELIYIAVDAATTHLYSPGIRVHMQNAKKHGATRHEIMEVLELTSVLGIHTATVGVPALLDELQNAGKPVSRPLTERQEALKERFIQERGYWSEIWEGPLLLAPDFFEAYLNFSAVPFQGGGYLEPKMKELVYVAIDVATTHLYDPGIRLHMRNALKYGGSAEELMEVIELTSVMGIHTATVGVPILRELFGDES